MRSGSMLLALLASHAAAAQPARPAEVAAARQLAREGFRLATAGDCAAAVEPLARAEALFHAPTTLLRLAECHLSLGRLLLGTEELRRVTLEDPGPAPSKAFAAARSRARALLAAAEPRLGHLTVVVTGADPASRSLHLDGEPLSAALVGVDLPVDPGPHHLQAEAPGHQPVERGVQVAEGGRERLELALTPDRGRQSPLDVPTTGSRPGVGAATSLVAAPPVAPVAAPLPAVRGWAIAALAVGAAGLGVGAGFGLSALGDKGRLDGACPARVCPASSRADLLALQRDATVSTIGWAAGGAAAAAALVLFLVPPGESGRAAWLAPAGSGLVARW